MHIGIIAIGTRGDVQPCVALGLGLQAAGHTVTIVAGSNYGDWIRGYGLGYADCGVDIQAVMSSETGREWVDSSQFQQLKHMRQTFLSVADQVITALVEVLPTYDALVTGLTMLPMTLPIAQHYNKPMVNLLFTPGYPTRAGNASMVPVRPRAYSRLNLLTRIPMLRGMWYTGALGVKMVCEKLGVEPIRYSDYSRGWMETPTVIAVSSQVVPPPPDYPDHVHVTGFLYLDTTDDYTPPAELAAFLADGEAPVYIGFGSMTGRNDPETLRLIVDAIDGRRAVVAQGWGSLGTDGLPPNIYPLQAAPHDWLFPQMAAVVHHGGAGTTAAGLRAGVPAVVIPHIADQPYYGRRVHELGVGAAPIPRKQLTAEKLGKAINMVVTDTTIREKAAQLGEVIRKEDGLTETVRWVEAYLQP